MRVTVLTENTACSDTLLAEHGLSLFLEFDNRRLLFDFGQTDAFAQNAAVLGVDLTTVDTAVLSHGHYDHGGGLSRFLLLNTEAVVYCSRHAFGAHYNGTEKYIGLDTALSSHPRLLFTDEQTDLGDNLQLISDNEIPPLYPIEPYGLTVKSEHGFTDERFIHEQSLLYTVGNERILISGCSHKGIFNLLERHRPTVFIGGFHFMKLDPDGQGRDTLELAAEILGSYNCTYYTCHCTGEAAFAFLRSRLGDKVQYLHGGDSLHFSL